MEKQEQYTPQGQQPDYANMTEQERTDALMKQAGMDPKSMKKRMAKTFAMSMLMSAVTAFGHKLISRFINKR